MRSSIKIQSNLDLKIRFLSNLIKLSSIFFLAFYAKPATAGNNPTGFIQNKGQIINQNGQLNQNVQFLHAQGDFYNTP